MDERGHLLPFPQAPDGVELRHLRAFVAVAEELNFSRAADRLYVSQPALSRQIRSLEQLVGCQLLKRSTHQVELTVAGEALLERSRKLLRDVDEAVSAALAVGGEHLARIARLLDPVRGLITEDAVATDLQQARESFESLQAQLGGPPAGTQVLPVTAGGVQSLVVYPAEKPRPTVLYLHGGGYIVGSAFGYQSHAGALALGAQTGVLVPDYRLAPEHPFPAALEDCLRAYRWLIGRGMQPDELVLAGISSGGGLVMSLLLMLRQERAPMPAAAVLLCPWLDLALQHPVDSHTAIAPVPSIDEVRRCANAYLAGHPLDDPIVDPLSADLTGLPPLLIQAATGDARIADAEALARRAQEHGVEARLELFPVDAHAFHLFWSFLPEAADAIDIAGNYIRELHSEREKARQRGGQRQHARGEYVASRRPQSDKRAPLIKELLSAANDDEDDPRLSLRLRGLHHGKRQVGIVLTACEQAMAAVVYGIRVTEGRVVAELMPLDDKSERRACFK